MPGMLKRSHDDVDAGGAGIDAPATDQQGSRKRQNVNGLNGEHHQNGRLSADNVIATNGVPAGDSVDEKAMTHALDLLVKDSVPEIFHVTQGFQPLSVLIQRLAQDTFNNLDDLITANAELQQPQVNGHGAGQASAVGMEKKNRIWDFAQGSRVKFIKLLVLSDWSRRAEDVSKVIDINHWIMTQKACFKDAVNWMGELKRIMNQWKAPPPDVKTALETLSSGRAAWIPNVSHHLKEFRQ